MDAEAKALLESAQLALNPNMTHSSNQFRQIIAGLLQLRHNDIEWIAQLAERYAAPSFEERGVHPTMADRIRSLQAKVTP